MANSSDVHLAGCAGSGREESWGNHYSQHIVITVAGALHCPMCAKQDADCLISVGGRIEQGIFQHIYD